MKRVQKKSSLAQVEELARAYKARVKEDEKAAQDWFALEEKDSAIWTKN